MQTQKNFFSLQKFAANFFAFLSFFAEKMLKMTISTIVWGAQHLNAGQNIQQMLTCLRHNPLKSLIEDDQMFRPMKQNKLKTVSDDFLSWM